LRSVLFFKSRSQKSDRESRAFAQWRFGSGLRVSRRIRHLFRIRLGDMRIVVKKSMGRMFALDVDAQDTVWVVKAKIQEQHCIPIENQMLCFTGPALVNFHILQDLGVKDDSVLCLLDRGFFEIVVSIDRCNDIFVLVEASDIAEDLKKRIEKKAGVPERQQLIFFNRHFLNETQALSQLGIRAGSILHVFTVCPAREWVPEHPV
jgi:hypothetical protein